MFETGLPDQGGLLVSRHAADGKGVAEQFWKRCGVDEASGVAFAVPERPQCVVAVANDVGLAPTLDLNQP